MLTQASVVTTQGFLLWFRCDRNAPTRGNELPSHKRNVTLRSIPFAVIKNVYSFLQFIPPVACAGDTCRRDFLSVFPFQSVYYLYTSILQPLLLKVTSRLLQVLSFSQVFTTITFRSPSTHFPPGSTTLGLNLAAPHSLPEYNFLL